MDAPARLRPRRAAPAPAGDAARLQHRPLTQPGFPRQGAFYTARFSRTRSWVPPEGLPRPPKASWAKLRQLPGQNSPWRTAGTLSAPASPAPTCSKPQRTQAQHPVSGILDDQRRIRHQKARQNGNPIPCCNVKTVHRLRRFAEIELRGRAVPHQLPLYICALEIWSPLAGDKQSQTSHSAASSRQTSGPASASGMPAGTQRTPAGPLAISLETAA